MTNNRTALAAYDNALANASTLTMADWNTLADDLALELGRLIRQGASLETMRKYAARIGDCEGRIVRI